MVKTTHPPLIMVLDDDIEFRDLVAEALDAKGYDIMRVSRANQAMELLDKAPVDLMIVDGLLPEMNGQEFIQQARMAGFQVPVIFVSAFSAFHRDLEIFHHLTKKLQVAQVLSKPLTMQELLLHVDNTLNEKAIPPESTDSQDGIQRVIVGTTSPNVDEAANPPQDNDPFRELGQRYVGKLETRLNELLQSLTKARQHDEGNESLQKAHHIAHKIHGTAGSYGFMKVSKTIGYVETLLSEMLAQKLPKHPEVWGDIQNHLEQAIELTIEQRKVLLQQPEAKRSSNELTHILILDRDPETITTLMATAQKNLIQPCLASSLETALQLYPERNFDMVFLDLHISSTSNDPPERNEGQPLESGIRMAQRMQNMDRFQQVPIAFLTETPTLRNRVNAANAGASHFLTKPLQELEILEVIQSIANEKRSRQPKVLIVDDDESFAQDLGSTLREKSFQTLTLSAPARILDVMNESNPDLLLLDFLMPGFNGIDLAKMLRSMTRWKSLPILLMTARTDPETRATALRSGLDDYIPKPILLDELLARMNLHLQRIKALEYQRHRDPLTGLLTRHSFLDAMSSRLEEAQRFQKELGLCFLDIDNLKQINDAYGYKIGDQVLSTLGQILQKELRLYDACCHWQDDQFALLFYQTNQHQCSQIMTRVLENVSTHQFASKGGIAFHVQLSGSLAMYPNPCPTLEELLYEASHKLLQAQTHGGNQIIM